MPPFSLRMVMPVASHLKAYADENLSHEGSKGRSCSVGFIELCGFSQPHLSFNP